MDTEAQLVAALQQQHPPARQQPQQQQQSPTTSTNGGPSNGGDGATPPNASGSKGDMAANMAANRDHLSFRRLEITKSASALRLESRGRRTCADSLQSSKGNERPAPVRSVHCFNLFLLVVGSCCRSGCMSSERVSSPSRRKKRLLCSSEVRRWLNSVARASATRETSLGDDAELGPKTPGHATQRRLFLRLFAFALTLQIQHDG